MIETAQDVHGWHGQVVPPRPDWQNYYCAPPPSRAAGETVLPDRRGSKLEAAPPASSGLSACHSQSGS